MRPPPTPAIGASLQQALWLYPGASRIAANPSFGGKVYRLVHEEDRVHLFFVADRLEEAVFNTAWSSQSAKGVAKKLKDFLNAYGDAKEYEVKLENGFGITMQRKDKQLYALYSYTADVFSVGLMTDGKIRMPDWELRDTVP